MTYNTDKGYITRQLMTYGAIIAVITTVYSIILYATGTNEFIPDENRTFITNLRPIIMGLGIFYSVKHLSEKILQSRLTFIKFFLYGLAIGFFFSIIDSAYFVVFINYISPKTYDVLFKTYNELLSKLNFSVDEVSLIMTNFKKPFTLFISYIFSDTLMTGFFSLLFAFLYSLINTILSKKQ